ncbi:hypothetical protein SAY87_014191 [Trapa incisa]|uniref:ENTH domain-containing protein n=1 Tax=Trapa incisa TaxID=236973 RepID=A0AAN7GJQ3_9MYRT|nr:hypothetical protein SAY87_014191 [Trapa incisa]
MAPSRLRRAIGAVKDRTSISLAMVGNSSSLSELDVAIVKATRHEEFPADEKYVQEILSLTCYSRAHISACISSLSRRLNKTRNWTVALKTLMLIQRLLAEGDPTYEQEIFFATRRGTRILNMSDFRDSSSRSNSWDCSAFVRTYALYLDERLEHMMQGRRGKRNKIGFDEEDDGKVEADEDQDKAATFKVTPMQGMKNERLFTKLQHLQQLLERFLACKPTGVARKNRVVFVALYPVVKESFLMYYEMTDIMAVLIDRFPELEVPDCVRTYQMFSRIGKQYEDLDAFYNWCKSVGVARSSEYPEVEKITQKRLDMMNEFIRDHMAQNDGAVSVELRNEDVQESDEDPPPEPEPIEEDMNSIKALPPPEGFIEPSAEAEEERDLEEEIKENLQLAVVEVDLLNLGEDAATPQQHGDALTLALFDGMEPTTAASDGPNWEAFVDDTPDWEQALVQSGSKMSNQPAVSMGGGFDMLLLNGMYQQGAAASSMNYAGNGSASNVALGSAGGPAMLALPAPPTAGPSDLLTNTDPFAPSVAVPQPPYVQMYDMETKQRHLMAEQQMWQQYAQNRMQGTLGFSNLPANPYNNMGGYPRNY